MTTITVEQRSCLLRAARARLSELHFEYDTLTELGEVGEQRNVREAEMQCLLSGISWLWQQTAFD